MGSDFTPAVSASNKRRISLRVYGIRLDEVGARSFSVAVTTARNAIASCTGRSSGARRSRCGPGARPARPGPWRPGTTPRCSTVARPPAPAHALRSGPGTNRSNRTRQECASIPRQTSSGPSWGLAPAHQHRQADPRSDPNRGTRSRSDQACRINNQPDSWVRFVATSRAETVATNGHFLGRRQGSDALPSCPAAPETASGEVHVPVPLRNKEVFRVDCCGNRARACSTGPGPGRPAHGARHPHFP